MEFRDATDADVTPLAELWYDGWQDGHRGHVPEALAEARTRESFHQRMAESLKNVRALGPVGDPVGFHLIEDDELNQFYLSARCRGSGLATKLMADAEAEFVRRGITRPWLACAIGNERAAAFYRKAGWHLARDEEVVLDTIAGPFSLKIWRFEKDL